MATALTVAAEHGAACDAPGLLRSGGANLVVHLAPAPVVARIAWLTAQIRSEPARTLSTEVALCRWAQVRGGAVRPPVEGPLGAVHARDGHVMSFWPYLDEVTPVRDANALGHELARLHDVLRAYPGRLPGPEWVGADAHRTSLLLARLGELDTADTTDVLDELVDVVAQVRVVTQQRLAGQRAGRVQALHGDPHGRNATVADGRLLWIDLEDAWFGPVEFDLVVASTGVDEGAVAGAYVGAGGMEPDPGVTALCRRLRELQVLTWSWLLEALGAGR